MTHPLPAKKPPVRRPSVRPDAERDAMVRDNIGLAAWAAKRFRATLSNASRRRYTRDDALSDASVGLLRAAELYDPAGGSTFGYYASFWMRQCMQRGLWRSRPVRTPQEGGRAVLNESPDYEHGRGMLTGLRDRADDFAAVEAREAVEAAILRVKRQYRWTVRARLAGLTLVEIARATGRTRGRAQQVAAMGMAQLEAALRAMPGLAEGVASTRCG